MNRAAFDHAVRAAGAVLGEDEVLVIGSQALHGSVDELPVEAERSMEVDVAAVADPDEHKADLIDGSIGEASMFHETFGFCTALGRRRLVDHPTLTGRLSEIAGLSEDRRRAIGSLIDRTLEPS